MDWNKKFRAIEESKEGTSKSDRVMRMEGYLVKQDDEGEKRRASVAWAFNAANTDLQWGYWMWQ